MFSWDVKNDAVIIKTLIITNKSNIESNLVGLLKLTILKLKLYSNILKRKESKSTNLK